MNPSWIGKHSVLWMRHHVPNNAAACVPSRPLSEAIYVSIFNIDLSIATKKPLTSLQVPEILCAIRGVLSPP